MSDLVIAALSGAGVTITVAIVVALLGLRLSDAKEQTAEARISDERTKGQLGLARHDLAVMTARAELAEKRLRDADALVAEVARDMPTDGAFERLLRAYHRARSLDGTGGAPEPVPDKPTSGTSGSDDLLRPGD